MTAPRRPTMVDLAREANCSTALVSIVMRDAPGASPETRRRVKEIARRLGYRPDQRARSLRQNRSQRIGVLFTVANPFHAEVAEALGRAALGSGYELVLSFSTPDASDAANIEPLLGERCEAMILLGSTSTEQELARLNGEIPIVVVGKELGDTALGTVRVDDVAAIDLAMNHLVALGHRRITHVDGDGSPSADIRALAYRAAMARAGLAQNIQVIRGGWTARDGLNAAGELMGRGSVAGIPMAGLPTAVLAFNDLVAVGVMNYLVRRGVQVPTEVSIVGFDNSVAESAVVPLTSVDQDPQALARVALEQAILRAEQRSAPADLQITPRLITRESVRDLTGSPD